MSKNLHLILVLFLYITSITQLFGKVPGNDYELYGFIRNDFYYNSRMNEEVIDGTFHLFPKPIATNLSGIDENDVPQSEMISVATRLGLNIKGGIIAGAKTFAKVEVDFAGSGALYFLLRLRQSYLRLDWNKTALTIGQTWHPMFSSVLPTGVSFNSGVPFQPFNRSPQLRIDHHLTPSLNMIGAAIYQMQYTSSGPIGPSAIYMKNSMTPDLFGGIEWKKSAWISGFGLDYKRLKPDNNNYISAVSAIAYFQYQTSKWQVKAKGILGQNMTDHLMPGGYGKSYSSSSDSEFYTNINTLSSWMNVLYGNKWQVGFFGGYLQNLGSGKALHASSNAGQFTVYGRGFYKDSQEMLDRLIRISPLLIYKESNFQVGIQYSITTADYGKIKSDGRVTQPYKVSNHRVSTSMIYYF